MGPVAGGTPAQSRQEGATVTALKAAADDAFGQIRIV
jgi:hypothetical protein